MPICICPSPRTPKYPTAAPRIRSPCRRHPYTDISYRPLCIYLYPLFYRRIRSYPFSIAQQPPIELFNSLENATALRNNRGVGQLQFRLAPDTPLEAATLLKTRTTPGLTGFQLVNPELMDCKNRTKIGFKLAYKRMYRQSMVDFNRQLRDLNAHITELERLIGMLLDQIPNQGPPITQRNRGLQEVIYLQPPVYLVFSLHSNFFKFFIFLFASRFFS